VKMRSGTTIIKTQVMSEPAFKQRDAIEPGRLRTLSPTLHPAWRAFIEFCAELKHGEIETLKIQDGLPVLAEVVKKKVKFAS